MEDLKYTFSEMNPTLTDNNQLKLLLCFSLMCEQLKYNQMLSVKMIYDPTNECLRKIMQDVHVQKPFH